MLLPLSHEKMTVRRLPIVTLTIIAVTVLLHVIASVDGGAREERAMGAMLTARLLYLQRPSLGVCPPLREYVSQQSPSGGAELVEMDGEHEAAARTEYDAACHALAETYAAIPAARFGYVPARANFLGLFTYMFVHAGIWHLASNMWFLFLCGLALEDRWGRAAFAIFYVVSGVVAAGVYHLSASTSTVPVIGASGAVAAAMGAFVVLFAATKIRFVGFLVRPVSFAAPAYIMLPLWVAIELVQGLVLPDSGTAHWAHVGGFLFGLAVAAAFRWLGVDHKLDNAAERAAVLGNDPRVDAARALTAQGETAAAVALLEGLAKEKPSSVHVWEALRDAARADGDTTVAGSAAQSIASLEAARQRPSRSPEPSAPPSGSNPPPSARSSRPPTPSSVAQTHTETEPFFPSVKSPKN